MVCVCESVDWIQLTKHMLLCECGVETSVSIKVGNFLTS